MFSLFDTEMNGSYISQNRASLRHFVTAFGPLFLYSSWYYERKQCGKLRNEMKTGQAMNHSSFLVPNFMTANEGLLKENCPPSGVTKYCTAHTARTARYDGYE